MEQIFNPVVNFGEVRRAQLTKSTLLTSTLVPETFTDLLRSVQMLMREWGAESNGKLPYLSIPSKTAAWFPEFVVEDLPLSRTTALVPEFAVKYLPSAEYSDDIYIYIYIYSNTIFTRGFSCLVTS